MKCPRCKNKGYTQGSVLLGDQEQKSFNKCNEPGCTHTHKYYVFIRDRYANTPKDNVIQVDFKSRTMVEDK